MCWEKSKLLVSKPTVRVEQTKNNMGVVDTKFFCNTCGETIKIPNYSHDDGNTRAAIRCDGCGSTLLVESGSNNNRKEVN